MISVDKSNAVKSLLTVHLIFFWEINYLYIYSVYLNIGVGRWKRSLQITVKKFTKIRTVFIE